MENENADASDIGEADGEMHQFGRDLHNMHAVGGDGGPRIVDVEWMHARILVPPSTNHLEDVADLAPLFRIIEWRCKCTALRWRRRKRLHDGLK